MKEKTIFLALAYIFTVKIDIQGQNTPTMDVEIWTFIHYTVHKQTEIDKRLF